MDNSKDLCAMITKQRQKKKKSFQPHRQTKKELNAQKINKLWKMRKGGK